MEVTIRRATVRDARGVVDVINSVIEEGGLTSLYPALTLHQEERFIEQLGPRSIMYVAEVSRAILGVQTLDLYAPYTRAMDHVGAVGTYVYRHFRGHGVGRRLFEATLGFARQHGYEKLISSVRASNAGAQAFYRSMGFVPKTVLERQIKIDGQYDDQVWMERFVSPLTEAEVEQARASLRTEPRVEPITDTITVRRAKRSDIRVLAAIMRGSVRWRVPPTEDQVLEMLGEKGYWLVLSRAAGGLCGWRAENLVMCIEEFYVYPPSYYEQVGGPLLEAMETEAKSLRCEVALSFLEATIAPQAIQFFEGRGYVRRSIGDLHAVWQDIAHGLTTPTNLLMAKPLREDRAVRPL